MTARPKVDLSPTGMLLPCEVEHQAERLVYEPVDGVRFVAWAVVAACLLVLAFLFAPTGGTP